MKATTKQKQLIHVNAPNRDIKEELVQWATGDMSKTSCNDLDFTQANAILRHLGVRPITMLQEDTPKHWGKFDKHNKQHAKVRSTLITMGWRKTDDKFGVIADMERFGEWLQSGKSPVKKPLLKMEPSEVSIIIHALERMSYKKHQK